MQQQSDYRMAGMGEEASGAGSGGNNNLYGLNRLGFDETIRPAKVAWGGAWAMEVDCLSLESHPDVTDYPPDPGNNPFAGPRFDEKENVSRAANQSSTRYLPAVSVAESLRADSHFVFPDGRKLGAMSFDPFVADQQDAMDMGSMAMVTEAMAMATDETMTAAMVAPSAPAMDPCDDPCAGVVTCCCECCCQEVCCCDEEGEGGGRVDPYGDTFDFDLDKVLERTRDRARRLELLGSDGQAGDDVYKFLQRNRKYGDGYCPPSEEAKGVVVGEEQVEVTEDGLLVKRGKREVDHNLHGSVRWVTRDGGVPS